MDSEHKETYNSKPQRSMPSANDELKLPEAMEELVVSNRALEHHSVDENARQNPLQQLVVYDEKHKTDVHKFLYDELAAHKESPVLIPKELVQLILGYLPFHEFKGECACTIDGSFFQETIELSNGIIAAFDHNHIILIDSTSGNIIKKISIANSNDRISTTIKLSKNILVITSSDESWMNHKIALYNCATGTCIRETFVQAEDVPFLFLIKLPNHLLAVAQYNGSNQIQIWDTKTLTPTKLAITTNTKIADLAKASQQKKLLAACAYDKGSISLYQWDTGECKQTIETKQTWPNLIPLADNIIGSRNFLHRRFNADNADSELQLWDCTTGKLLGRISNVANNKIVRLPNRLLAIFSVNGKRNTDVRLVDPRTGTCTKKFEVQDLVIYAEVLSNGCLLLHHLHHIDKGNIDKEALKIWR
jgi:WD40 repeat protein